MKRSLVPLKKDPGTLPKVYTADLSPSLPQGELQPFFKGTVDWGKGTNQTLWVQGTLNVTGSSPCRISTHATQMMDGVSAQAHPAGPQSHPVVFSPAPDAQLE